LNEENKYDILKLLQECKVPPKKPQLIVSANRKIQIFGGFFGLTLDLHLAKL
jgi:hypothetical protein